MTNRGLLLFLIIFFVFSSIGNYMFRHEKDIISSIAISAVSSLIVFLIFIVKREWDKKQKM